MTMAAPLDQQILDELASRLGDISATDPDNGYYTDAGEVVLTEETEKSEDDLSTDEIILEVLDVSEDLAKQSKKYRTATLKVLVRAILKAELTTARAKAREVLADIRKAIRGIEPCDDFVTGVLGLELGGRRINPREPGSGVTVAELDLSITYTELY